MYAATRPSMPSRKERVRPVEQNTSCAKIVRSVSAPICTRIHASSSSFSPSFLPCCCACCCLSPPSFLTPSSAFCCLRAPASPDEPPAPASSLIAAAAAASLGAIHEKNNCASTKRRRGYFEAKKIKLLSLASTDCFVTGAGGGRRDGPCAVDGAAEAGADCSEYNISKASLMLPRIVSIASWV